MYSRAQRTVTQFNHNYWRRNIVWRKEDQHRELNLNFVLETYRRLRATCLTAWDAISETEGKKVNRKVQGMPQSQTAANPRHQEKKDKNIHAQNKQMYEKHKDQLPLPQARWSEC